MKTYASKMKRRFFSLFIPYFFWQASHEILLSHWGIREFVNRIFFISDFPEDGPLWYLYAIFLLALMSPVFYLFLRKKKGIIVVLVIAVAVFLIKDSTVEGIILYAIMHRGYIPNVTWCLAAYLLGGYFGLHIDEIDKETMMKILVCLLLAAFVADCIWDGFFKSFTISTMPMLLIHFFPAPENANKIKLFNAEFLMYATHFYLDRKFAVDVRNVLYKIVPSVFLNNIVGTFICLAITIVA